MVKSVAAPSTTTRERLTLLAMCVATFMIQLDVTIVNVALPSIQHGLGTTPGELEWVISAYALALAALIPVGGTLGDRYGRRRVFLVGTLIFTLGSVCCALAMSDDVLIAFRAVQGVGGAAMLALTLSIITETFSVERRAGAIGTWAAIGGTGFGVGPVVGGILLGFYGWESVFWVNLPFAAITIALTLFAVPESRATRVGRFDVVGVITSSLGLVGVTLGLVEASGRPWMSPAVLVPMLAGTASLVFFARWECRVRHPMIPPALFRARSFVSASAVYLIGYTAFSGVLFSVTLLYQDLDGWSALRTGLSWLFMNVPFLVMAQLTGLIDRRHSPARVVAGACLLAAIGLFLLSRVDATTPFALTAAGYLLSGAGFGILVPGVTHVAMRDVPSGVSGAASGVLNSARQVGTSVGLAVLGGIAATTATAQWSDIVRQLPDTIRGVAQGQAQDVAGAHVSAVVGALGPGYRHLAEQAFLNGYQLAIGIGAACLLVAAGIAFVGFRRTEA